MPKYLLAASLALAMNTFAQIGQFGMSRGMIHVTGEVRHDPSTALGEFAVELYDSGQHQVIDRAHVSNDGSFEFRGISAGNYEVRLVSRYGNTIRTEYVQLNQATESVVISMSQPQKTLPAGTVDVSQLAHRVNKKAMSEYRLAAKAMSGGDTAGSVPHLRKSIEADPEFAGAHHQLGVALMAMDQPEKARAELQAALSLEPALALGYMNLAIVDLKLNQAGESELAARRAVKLDPTVAKAHFVLALSLIQQRKYGQETLDNLRAAADEFPQARDISSRLRAQLQAVK